MPRCLTGFLVILSLTVAGLHADPVRLQLSECLKLAEQQNYDIKSAQSDIKAEEGKAQAVRSMFFPQLSLTAVATSHRIRYADFLEQDYDNLRTIPGSLGQLLVSMAPEESRAMLGQEIQRLMGGLEMPEDIPDRIDHLQTSLMLTQPIFTGLRLTNSYRAVQQTRQAAIHRHTEKKVELTYQVTQSFYQALLMNHVVEIHRMALESGNRHLSIIESMYKEGLASEWEYMKAQVNVRGLTPDLIEAEKNRDLVLSKLKLLMGMDQEQALELLGEFVPAEFPNMTDPDSLYRLAEQNRPDLEYIRARKSAGRYQIKAARGEYLPTIGAFASYTWRGIKTDEMPGSSDFSRIGSLGLSLQWEFLTFGRHHGKLIQAKADYAKAENSELKIINAIHIQIRDAVKSLEYARQALMTQQDAVSLAEKSNQIAEIAFTNGEARQIDVLDAQLDLKTARIKWYQAVYNSITAQLDYRQSIGQLTPSTL